MARTLKLVLWELVPLVCGLLYLFVQRPGPWESPHLRWLTIGLIALYVAVLANWLRILWRGGWGAVVARLERRAAGSKISISPLRQNLTLAVVALLLLGFVVAPILLKPH